MGMLAKLTELVRLRWLLRHEYDSLALRRWFATKFHVEVGLYSYGCFDRWRIPARTRIGRYCSFAKSVRILDANHPYNELTTHPFLYEKQFGVVPVDRIESAWLIIEDDVWIGHNATIAPSCKFIGRGAIIGAGSVVTSAVAAYSIVAGVPARKLRDRFSSDLICAIEASEWWKLDKSGLRRLLQESPASVFQPSVENLGVVGRLQGK